MKISILLLASTTTTISAWTTTTTINYSLRSSTKIQSSTLLAAEANGKSVNGGADAATPKKILVLGGDGFCGWPTSLYLSDRGHDVVIVDNLSRRKIDIELGCDSLTPIQSPEVGTDEHVLTTTCIMRRTATQIIQCTHVKKLTLLILLPLLCS